MKRRARKLLGILLTAGLLSGCGAQEQDDQEQNYAEESEQPEQGEAGDASDSGNQSIQAQLELIVDHVDEWAFTMDYANDVYEYAVTDLDKNGRLEIIAANMGGTGYYTYSNFYEVNETFDGLQLCERDVEEGESQADLGDADVDAYYDSETGVIYYMFRDYIKNGAAEYYGVQIAVSLVDGKLTEEPIAFYSEIYTDSGCDISYRDAEGQEITAEEYESAADTVFAGMEKQAAQFLWLEYYGSEGVEELKDLSRKEMLEVLWESYEGFVFQIVEKGWHTGKFAFYGTGLIHAVYLG